MKFRKGEKVKTKDAFGSTFYGVITDGPRTRKVTPLGFSVPPYDIYEVRFVRLTPMDKFFLDTDSRSTVWLPAEDLQPMYK